LAVKGFLKIEETKEEGIILTQRIIICETKRTDGSLSLFERELMSHILVPCQETGLRTENSFYAYIDLLKTRSTAN
jgi:hypothetical protein